MQGRAKKPKPILAPPQGAGKKSCHIPIPQRLWGGKNPHKIEQGGSGKNCHPYCGM